MVTMPTYLDLFGSDTVALEYYRELFPAPAYADDIILNSVSTSYAKISFLFGEFREYEVDEDTLRNDGIRKAVCFEANSILANSVDGEMGDGGLNNNLSSTAGIVSEKMEDVSITYEQGGSSGSAGIGDSSLSKVLGLLSNDSAIILSRYIRKSYGWSGINNCKVSIDDWCRC